MIGLTDLHLVMVVGLYGILVGLGMQIILDLGVRV